MRSPPYRSLRSVIRCGAVELPEGEEWRSIRSQNPAMFGLLLFFGLLAGTLCYLAIQAGRLAQQANCAGPWRPTSSFPTTSR